MIKSRCSAVPGVAPAILLGLLLAGCGGRDPVDAPVNWWHQLEGGEIAQQRPPPPNVDAPYPKVGTTPSKPPVMLSADLRASLTEHLIEQRNLNARLNASDPITTPVLPPAAPPPAPTTAASGATPGPGPGNTAPAATSPASGTAAAVGAAPAAPVMSSATLDAAEAPPPPPASAATTELAMPDVVPEQAGLVAASGPTPPIPAAPPGSPGLPGFPVLAGPTYAAPRHPDYALADQAGERLLFPDGSDALTPGQDGLLRTVVGKRGKTGIVYVHGFGDAASDAPAEQAQALTLAALRARTVANWLRENGVPPSSIRIRANAFGRGATAGLVD